MQEIRKNLNLSPMSPRWLTEREVAGITGLSVSTLQKQRLYSRGIPYSKIGKSVRYAYADIVAFMQANRVEPLTN
jgi:predicted DNA-binding transcriptional regulator AlpA